MFIYIISEGVFIIFVYQTSITQIYLSCIHPLFILIILFYFAQNTCTVDICKTY